MNYQCSEWSKTKAESMRQHLTLLNISQMFFLHPLYFGRVCYLQETTITLSHKSINKIKLSRKRYQWNTSTS